MQENGDESKRGMWLIREDFLKDVVLCGDLIGGSEIIWQRVKGRGNPGRRLIKSGIASVTRGRAWYVWRRER